MIKPVPEHLEAETKIGIRLPSPEGFLPRNFKALVEVEIPGQKAIENLTDSDRLEVGKKTAQVISGICPRLGPALITVHGIREGVVNVAFYTDSLLDINALKKAKKIFPLDAFDISDPENPKQLAKNEWMKK